MLRSIFCRFLTEPHNVDAERLFPYDVGIQYRVNNDIVATEVRVIGEDGSNLGVMTHTVALTAAREQGLDLIEISASANPPVVRIMSFDKFRYQKEKEDKKQKASQKAKEMKQVRITPRAASGDLQVKLKKVEEFLAAGHHIEIGVYLRGREKGNREWGLGKLKEFLAMIKSPHNVTLAPRPGGRGFISQIVKK